MRTKYLGINSKRSLAKEILLFCLSLSISTLVISTSAHDSWHDGALVSRPVWNAASCVGGLIPTLTQFGSPDISQEKQGKRVNLCAEPG